MPDPTPASPTPETTPAPAAAPAAEPSKPSAVGPPVYDEDTKNARAVRDFVKAHPELRKMVKGKWYETQNIPKPKDDPDFADEPADTKPAPKDETDPNEAAFTAMADQAFYGSLAGGNVIEGEAKWHKEYGPHIDRVLSAIVRGKKDARTARQDLLGFLKEYADLKMAASKTQTTTTEPEHTETSGERESGGGGASTSKEPETIEEAFRQAKKENGVSRLAEFLTV